MDLPNETPDFNYIVSSDGSGDYQTISQALEKTPINGAIKVLPGIYQEKLVLSKSVYIYGEGDRDQIIIENLNDSSIVMKCDHAIIKGLTIKGKSLDRSTKYYTIDIPQGNLTLDHCTISSDSLASIAIYGADAHPNIRDCILNQGQCGIKVYAKGKGIIENCEILNHTYAGIEITNEGDPNITNTSIHDNYYGIYICNQGLGLISDCDIHQNSSRGIQIESAGDPTVRSCKIHDNKDDGIWILNNGKGSIENCDVGDNYTKKKEKKSELEIFIENLAAVAILIIVLILLVRQIFYIHEHGWIAWFESLPRKEPKRNEICDFISWLFNWTKK